MVYIFAARALPKKVKNRGTLMQAAPGGGINALTCMAATGSASANENHRPSTNALDGPGRVPARSGAARSQHRTNAWPPDP